MADLPPEPGPPSFWGTVGLTFSATVRNARTCLALVALYAVLFGMANAISQKVVLNLDPTNANSGELIALSAAALAGLGLIAAVGIFVYPPTLGALSLVGEAAVTGDVLETHGIVRRVFDRTLEVIGAFLLTGLLLLVAPIAAGLVALLVALPAGAEAGFAALIFMLLVLSVPAVYVLVRLSLAVPVVVLEGLGPVSGLQRSWDLVGGSWWWVFGVYVIVGVVGGVLGEVIATVFSVGSDNFVLSALGTTIAATVQGSLVGVVTGVLYACRAQVLPPAELRLPAEP